MVRAIEGRLPGVIEKDSVVCFVVVLLDDRGIMFDIVFV